MNLGDGVDTHKPGGFHWIKKYKEISMNLGDGVDTQTRSLSWNDTYWIFGLLIEKLYKILMNIISLRYCLRVSGVSNWETK